MPTVPLIVAKERHTGSTWFTMMLQLIPNATIRKEYIPEWQGNTGTLSLSELSSQMHSGLRCEGVGLQVCGYTMEPLNRTGREGLHWDILGTRIADTFGDALRAVQLQVPAVKVIFLHRSNLVKSALARAYIALRPSHNESMRHVGVQRVVEEALVRDRIGSGFLELRRTLKAFEKQSLVVYYEDLQADPARAMNSLLGFLGVVGPPSVDWGSATDAYKKSKEDLSQVLVNFAEFETAFSEGGKFASSCLLEMLRATAPRTFEPCPSAWVDETMARLLKAPCLHAWQHTECYR
jgi:hypothetical protein